MNLKYEQLADYLHNTFTTTVPVFTFCLVAWCSMSSLLMAEQDCWLFSFSSLHGTFRCHENYPADLWFDFSMFFKQSIRCFQKSGLIIWFWWSIQRPGLFLSLLVSSSTILNPSGNPVALSWKQLGSHHFSLFPCDHSSLHTWSLPFWYITALSCSKVFMFQYLLYSQHKHVVFLEQIQIISLCLQSQWLNVVRRKVNVFTVTCNLCAICPPQLLASCSYIFPFTMLRPLYSLHYPSDMSRTCSAPSSALSYLLWPFLYSFIQMSHFNLAYLCTFKNINCFFKLPNFPNFAVLTLLKCISYYNMPYDFLIFWLSCILYFLKY